MGFSRFAEVSPPGGGARICDSINRWGSATMHKPSILLLGDAWEARPTISSSESSTSIGLSTEPAGGRFWTCSSSFTVTVASVVGAGGAGFGGVGS